MKQVITKEMNIGEIVNLDAETGKILIENGMHCIGCPAAQAESLEEACDVHGIDCENLLNQLNDYLASK